MRWCSRGSTRARARSSGVFRRAAPLTDQDVALLTKRLHRRILRYLTRCGRLPKAEHDEEELQPDEPLLAELCAASVQGRVALGEENGASVERLGRRRDARPLFIPGELCCDIGGFSLHAKVEIAAHDRDGLERLCRYLARPPLATERLSLTEDGRVIHALRRHWKDGTRAFVFDPLDFIARLADPPAHLPRGPRAGGRVARLGRARWRAVPPRIANTLPGPGRLGLGATPSEVG